MTRDGEGLRETRDRDFSKALLSIILLSLYIYQLH